jgi:hypothetical protein
MVGRLDRRVKAIFIMLLFLISFSLSGTASQMQIPVAGQAATSRVLFLEHYLVANGTVAKGEAPFRSVNFPTYWYNENTGQLNGKIDFPVNNSLIMIFGDVLTLKGNFGAGTGNRLYGVYSLPVYADMAYVYGIDMSGNLAMGINQRTIVLKPGESYTYYEKETLKDKGAVIDVKYTHIYVNHGLIDKKSIGSSLVSP